MGEILGFVILVILATALIVGILLLISSGFGVPILVFPVAWYLMYKKRSKEIAKQKQAK